MHTDYDMNNSHAIWTIISSTNKSGYKLVDRDPTRIAIDDKQSQNASINS